MESFGSAQAGRASADNEDVDLARWGNSRSVYGIVDVHHETLFIFQGLTHMSAIVEIKY